MNKRQIALLILSIALSASSVAVGSGSKQPPKKTQATVVEMVMSGFDFQSVKAY